MDSHSNLMKLATLASTSVALILIVIKTWAYWSTGSLSLLGSLLDSMLDGVTSIVNLLAVRYAIIPPDEDHKFGHGKVESLAALGQSAFMIGSAAVLILNSFDSLFDQRAIVKTELGIAVSIIAIVLTLMLVAFQRYVYKRTQSLVIEADSLHYKGDLLMNLAVIAALGLAGWGLLWIDQVFALGIALFLGFNAWQIGARAWTELMDKHLPEVELRVYELVTEMQGCFGCHDVRSRQSGPAIFIQLHLELDATMPLAEAHKVGDALEKRIIQEYPRADVIIHHDPVKSTPNGLQPVGTIKDESTPNSSTPQ